jgi:hypothetical protein
MAALATRIRNARRLAMGWRWRLGHVVGTRIPAEFDDELADTFKRVRRHTLSSAARVAALCDATAYLAEQGVEGDLAECGVWRGGSMMAAALTLLRHGDSSRDLYLFDTYTGMAAPGERDLPSPYDGYAPRRKWERKQRRGWAAVPAHEVRANLESTGYPAERIHLVEGRVEETLPAGAPERLALLRLDTDWYESTRHELAVLFPRLVVGGVLIVDDYGHYAGARQAVDEYFATSRERILLDRIDYTGRIGVKQAPA